MRFKIHRLIGKFLAPACVILFFALVFVMVSCNLYTTVNVQKDLDTCKKQLVHFQSKEDGSEAFIESDEYID
jgi:hypothetical protein